METDEQRDDVCAIEALIARQFASLNWKAGTSADWNGFAADFAAGAVLYPSARPAKPQTVDEFFVRMQGLAGTTLDSFHETVLGTEIRIFGNVATALAACEMTENGTEANRGIEMLLLVKNEGRWQIVAQAWDTETSAKRIPEHLLREPTSATTR